MNVAPNGASVWQNDCQQIAHTGSRFDNNTAARGSSGIEMNQIAQADVTQCTFTTGRALKGAGLYLQVSDSLWLRQLEHLLARCAMLKRGWQRCYRVFQP